MGQWLIADLSVSDVHVQHWMLLVTRIVLLWVSLCLGNTIVFADFGLNHVKRRRKARAAITFLEDTATSGRLV
jgi:hypothetical protein